jgi:prepilin-type N-terminal cleavage/methylation domain-containing protein
MTYRPLCPTAMPPRQRAFTLTELMLAIGLAGLVSLAALSMLVAAGSATNAEMESRDLAADSRLAMSRVTSLIREAGEVLAVSDERLVLWLGDASGDGAINISEMRVIEHDPALMLVSSWEAGPGPSADAVFMPGDDFLTIAATAIADGSLSKRAVLRGVTAWSAIPDSPVPGGARSVRTSLSLARRGGDQELGGVTSLRATAP